jgi:Protein of unknown function (DUF3043)
VRLLRRRSAEEPPGDGSDNAESTDESRPGGRGHAPVGGTPGKGRPTPKRNQAQRRRTGPVPPPPRTRAEAVRRQRELGKRGRGDSVAARIRAGDDSALPRRDRGPERAVVRNLVDSRRNPGSAFLIVAGLVLVSYAVPSTVFRAAVLYVWIAVFALIIADGVMVSRRVSRLMRERFPQTRQRTVGLTLYGMNRTIMPRRWRIPAPQVKVGDAI